MPTSLLKKNTAKEEAINNLESAREQIIRDMRSGKLTIIGLDEGAVKGGFDDGIKFLYEGGCKFRSACVSYQDWLGGTGGVVNVKNVEISFHLERYTGSIGYGNALESIAHELRHLTYENRQKSSSGDYFNSDREADARYTGQDVRKFYGY